MGIRRHRRGANAVEFGLIVIPLTGFLFGTMEYSWLFFNQTMLDSATREGARAGSRVALASAASTAITASTAAWAKVTLPGTPVFTATTPTSNTEVLVVVNGTFTYVSIFGSLVPTPSKISSDVAVRLETQ